MNAAAGSSRRNQNMQKAQVAKNDEFYTRLTDIEKELENYEDHFRGKKVLCNCDDPRVSQFFHYFSFNFEKLGLKKLITTCYKSQNADLFSRHDKESAISLVYEGDKNGSRMPDPEEIGIRILVGDGDFRSPECVEMLHEADIVVTNPPFSLFREYVAQLVERDKKFLIVGNKNAVTYREIFPLIRDNRMWIGATPMGREMFFDIPEDQAAEIEASGKFGRSHCIIDGGVKGRSTSTWFTNLEHNIRHKEIPLFMEYSPVDYPRYDNYDAIEVGKVKEIPKDYDGAMGVPITYLDKHCPDQFKILGATESEGKGFSGGLWDPDSGVAQPLVEGRRVYKRIFIRHLDTA